MAGTTDLSGNVSSRIGFVDIHDINFSPLAYWAARSIARIPVLAASGSKSQTAAISRTSGLISTPLGRLGTTVGTSWFSSCRISWSVKALGEIGTGFEIRCRATG